VGQAAPADVAHVRPTLPHLHPLPITTSLNYSYLSTKISYPVLYSAADYNLTVQSQTRHHSTHYLTKVEELTIFFTGCIICSIFCPTLSTHMPLFSLSFLRTHASTPYTWKRFSRLHRSPLSRRRKFLDHIRSTSSTIFHTDSHMCVISRST
jgi:hypothetical protein